MRRPGPRDVEAAGREFDRLRADYAACTRAYLANREALERDYTKATARVSARMLRLAARFSRALADAGWGGGAPTGGARARRRIGPVTLWQAAALVLNRPDTPSDGRSVAELCAALVALGVFDLRDDRTSRDMVRNAMLRKRDVFRRTGVNRIGATTFALVRRVAKEPWMRTAQRLLAEALARRPDTKEMRPRSEEDTRP